MGLRVPINLIGKAEEIGLNSKARESGIKVETFFRSTKLIAIFPHTQTFPGLGTVRLLAISPGFVGLLMIDIDLHPPVQYFGWIEL
jgi:hypothetical protein